MGSSETSGGSQQPDFLPDNAKLSRMTTTVPDSRIVSTIHGKTSCFVNGARQRPLTASSASAVLGKRRYICNGKNHSVCQAITSGSFPGSNAQPAVQLPVECLKSKLQQEIEGTKRGIFGIKAGLCACRNLCLSLSSCTAPVRHCATAAFVQAAKGQAIEDLLQQLEEQTCPLDVTEALDQLDGSWQLLYTSLTIKVRYRFLLSISKSGTQAVHGQNCYTVLSTCV